MIKRLNDIRSKLDVLRQSKTQKGVVTGFNSLDSLYTIKKGSYTFVLGSPTHGKSEFIFELLMNRAVKGERSLIYSPETGSVEEILAELIHKFTGKTAYLTGFNPCTDDEYLKALTVLDWHFLIVDSEEKAYSINELFKMVDDYEEKNKGEVIDYIMAEPYNEIRHDMTEFGARQDLYIEQFVGDIRRYCKKRNKHAFISLHPTSQQPKTDAIGTYYPKPLPREAAGGQALFRKAMCWITIWRPPGGLNHANGVHGENDLIISIDKAKPKGVATKGETLMYFDWQKNRYYEELNGIKLYAFEHEKTVISHDKIIMQPSKHFSEPEDKEIPF